MGAVHVLFLLAVSTCNQGLLLDPGVSQSLQNQLQQINSLGEAVQVITLILREVDELKRVISTQDAQANQLQGELNSHQGELQQLTQTLTQLTAAVTAIPATPAGWSSGGNGGAIFTRWGRTSCPSETELVYKGYTGGKHSSEAGGGSDVLCLPENPEWANYTVTKSSSYYAHVWGSEYAVPTNPLPNFHPNHDVPCAVCRSPTRSTALMIPARTDCYPSFHREYMGYLMSNYYGNAGDYDFVCVDSMPESEPGTYRNEGGLLFFFTVGVCGSLPCPPYENNREIPCVVCTK